MLFEQITQSEVDTIKMGFELGTRLRGGEVITLSGPLGAGKTSFVKGIGEALNISRELIFSPTFILRVDHEGRLPLAHIDLYRLNSPEEIQNIGLFEQENLQSVLVIEWPERAQFKLPSERFEIVISHEGEFIRRVLMTGIAKDFSYMLDWLK